MRPSDAIGGLALASQAIVVGDRSYPRQNFFAGNDGGAAAGGISAAAGQSSILDLADARLRQKRMLRPHYRSRHESLIAFSQKHFYEGDLWYFHRKAHPSACFACETSRQQSTHTLEHCVARCGLWRRDFFLQHIPVLRELTVPDTKDVHADHRLGSPTDKAAMNHH